MSLSIGSARRTATRASCYAAVLFMCLMGAARADVNLGIADDDTFKRPNSWGMLPQNLG